MAVQPRAPSDNFPSKNATIPPLSDTDAPARLQRWLRGGLTAFVGGFLAFIAWQYAFPDGYAGAIAGLNPRAIGQFESHLPFRFPITLTAAAWSLGFRLILLALWASYALVVLAVLRGASVGPRAALGTSIAVSLALAVFCPPLLTTDCYSYLGYSHLHVLYGLNPYVTTTAPLFARHDPVTRFLFWQVPTVYGPVWTALTDGIVRLWPGSLWGQIIAVKLIEAGALWAAALAGRRVADRFQPGWGNRALLAIGLNPLLLIEGAGNGHNDLLMLALALCAAALLLEKRYAWAGLLLGLSIGVKLITLALLPWLLLECWRRNTGRARWTAALPFLGGVLAPLVLGYAAFWHGPDTLLALQQRSLHGFDAAAQAQTARIGAWLSARGVAQAAIPLLTALTQRGGLVLLYAGLTVWLWRARPVGGWLTAWLLFAPCLMFAGMGDPFPWYIAWFWTPALLRGNRLSLGLSAASFLLALTWESLYAYLRPV